jgi:hypothetical protein
VTECTSNFNKIGEDKVGLTWNDLIKLAFCSMPCAPFRLENLHFEIEPDSLYNDTDLGFLNRMAVSATIKTYFI